MQIGKAQGQTRPDPALIRALVKRFATAVHQQTALDIDLCSIDVIKQLPNPLGGEMLIYPISELKLNSIGAYYKFQKY